MTENRSHPQERAPALNPDAFSVADAADWYNSREDGLGDRFVE